MKPKKNKLIIFILLGIAGLIGIAAVVVAIIYSQIKEVDPNDVNKIGTDPACRSIFVQVKNENDVYEDISDDFVIDVKEDIVIGTKFVAPHLNTGYFYDGFEFIVNNSFKKVVTFTDQTDSTLEKGIIEVTTSSDNKTDEFNITFLFSDLEEISKSNDTISITVRPLAVNFEDELEEVDGVKSCLPSIYSLNTEADPNQQYTCLKVGETGIDLCADLEEGETCTIEATPCCTGLERVNTCSKPSSLNQCAEEKNNCYICLTSTEDGVCSKADGENICNSPDDCAGTTPQDDPVEEPDDEPVEEPDDEPVEEPDDEPVINPTETSNFTVVKSGPSCVERISPNNIADFKITVTNSDSSYEDILQIKDKLPLGFIYQSGSTKINGTPDTQDTYVKVNTTGNTQEIVWSTNNGWSIKAGDTFTIEFRTTAGPQAITSEVQNEVILTPLNTPLDATTLRTEHKFTVAQSCETPETGILDELWAKLLIGLGIIMVAYYFYTSTKGVELAINVKNSGTYKAYDNIIQQTKGLYLKITNPRQYFEEKIERKDSKRKRSQK